MLFQYSMTFPAVQTAAASQPPVRYDFANNYVDAATFPVTSWRRHLNYALRDPAALSTYGSYQGEPSLRQALADYSRDARSVAVLLILVASLVC